jgi:hypothetical protein
LLARRSQAHLCLSVQLKMMIKGGDNDLHGARSATEMEFRCAPSASQSSNRSPKPGDQQRRRIKS